MWRGWLNFLVLSLRLNFRSRQALVYGYAVPVVFLIGFGSVFRSGEKPLLREMGQILTITALGGACFGLPTAMVSERERGIWRRYKLLPVSMPAIVSSAVVVRVVLIFSAAVLQWILARVIYGTPMPAHAMQLAVAMVLVCVAFCGIGLVIAMLADTVPAVQAIGQAVFLPMILIGGVGVPLEALPDWARRLALFLPGVHAVRALDACIGGEGLRGAWRAAAALGVMGVAAVAGASIMFRWDSGDRRRRQLPGLLIALAPWAFIGLLMTQGKPTILKGDTYLTITQAQIDAIGLDDLPDDNGLVTPVLAKGAAMSDETRAELARITQRLNAFNGAGVLDLERSLLGAAAVADLAHSPSEAETARAVFDRLETTIAREELEKSLAWLILHPEQGTYPTVVPALDLNDPQDAKAVRERAIIYAKKLLGRVRGTIAD